MFGLISKITAVSGQRDALMSALRADGELVGCLSYVTATDSSAPDTIWITEVWTDEASHRASLALPAVRQAIERARPLIAGFERVATTAPIRLL